MSLLSVVTSKDKHGLLRLEAGDTKNILYGTLRFNKFRGEDRKMTMLEHSDDLCDFWRQQFGDRQGPTSCLIFSDHGGDANFFTVKSFYVLGKFLRERRLGALWVSGPASNRSPENHIERRWALPKKALAGMSLPEFLNGDTVPPNQQSDINKDLDFLGKKETALYTVAGESVCAALNDLEGQCLYKTRYLLPEVFLYSWFQKGKDI
jgi:hypothetical protein